MRILVYTYDYMAFTHEVHIKISPCVDLRGSRKNYSVKVFKTMQGVHGKIGPFDIVFRNVSRCFTGSRQQNL